MIEILKKSVYTGKEITVARCSTLKDLINYVSYEKDLSTFGYNADQRTEHYNLFKENDLKDTLTKKRFCYVCYKDGKLVTPDRLVGLYRQTKNVPEYRIYRGRKRSYGNTFRKPKTKQEKTWFCFEKHDKLKLRSKRNLVNLPSSWDDLFKGKQRCWKKLRKKQYK